MSYEVWGEPEEYPECPHCEENAKVTDDLAQLVARLAHSLRRAAPDNDLPAKALDYLQREGLAGSPLRETPNGALRGEPLAASPSRKQGSTSGDANG